MALILYKNNIQLEEEQIQEDCGIYALILYKNNIQWKSTSQLKITSMNPR